MESTPPRHCPARSALGQPAQYTTLTLHCRCGCTCGCAPQGSLVTQTWVTDPSPPPTPHRQLLSEGSGACAALCAGKTAPDITLGTQHSTCYHLRCAQSGMCIASPHCVCFHACLGRPALRTKLEGPVHRLAALLQCCKAHVKVFVLLRHLQLYPTPTPSSEPLLTSFRLAASLQCANRKLNPLL